VGQTLSSENIKELQARDEAEVAYDRALHFLSYRPRSRAEIQAYLQRRKVAPDTNARVIDRLTEAELIDDEAFAQYWVENREAFRPRGKRSLRFELRRKGIPGSVIDRAVGDIDETDSAYRAAQSKARQLGQLDYQMFRRRLSGFLQRRGFDYDTVKETVRRLWQEVHITADDELI
jgi:regulatory protein